MAVEQEVTARPQDVALLPLPAVLWQWLSRHTSEQDANDVAEAVRHYARANVTAALASAQAREEELRAELIRIERENREGWKQAAHWRGRVESLEGAAHRRSKEIESLGAAVQHHVSRAERLAEALRECRPFVAYAYDQGIMGAEEAGRNLDALLSTNAAQPGETT